MPRFFSISRKTTIWRPYSTALCRRNRFCNTAIVEAYDFSGIWKIVDIGGGHGATLTAIMERNSDMQGELLDLPKVVADVSFETPELADRSVIVGSDMMTSVPVGGDAHIITRVMMDKTDDDAVTVLRNCRAAMNEGGEVLVIDPVLLNVNEPHHNWLAYILMMVLTYGRCRTVAQFHELFDAAGLKLTRVIEATSPNVIVEGMLQ